MSPFQSCMDAVRGFVSCSPRQRQQHLQRGDDEKRHYRSRFGDEDDDADYPNYTPAVTFIRSYSQGNTVWKTVRTNTNTNRGCGRWNWARESRYIPETAAAAGAEEEEDVAQRVFLYDIVLPTTRTAAGAAGRKREIYRRLVLDFSSDSVDAVSDEIPRVLGLPVAPYDGPEVRMPNRRVVMPVGIVEMKWRIYRGRRWYRMSFLVVEDSPFDMLVGRESIWKCRLWEEDGDIAKRLRGSGSNFVNGLVGSSS